MDLSDWNPLTGCDKIAPGCTNCHAERMSLRLKLMGQPNYRHGFELTLHPHALELPLKWKKPQRIFVNSMSDLFHKDVPAEFIQKVFATMRQASWHRFQILTKWADRLAELSASTAWPANVWMGVSVESADYAFRIDHLRGTGAAVRFLSVEPLLGPISQLDLRNIHWVIVGGESGPGPRPMKEEWLLEEVVGSLDKMSGPDSTRWRDFLYYIHVLLYHSRSEEEQAELNDVIDRSIVDSSHQKENTKMGRTMFRSG